MPDPAVLDRSPAGWAWADRARHRATARLGRLVADNRFAIVVVIPAVGAALLVGAAAGLVPATLAFHPVLLLAAVAGMRLPLVPTLLPTIDRRAVVGLVGLTGFVYAVELVAVATGWPYGAFAYTRPLGPMVAGVPAGLALLYLPLAIDAWLLALVVGPTVGRDGWLAPDASRFRVGGRVARVGTAVAILLAIDLVLDPGAVALGFWTYAAGGPIYGVPLSNLGGWVLVGGATLVGLEATLDADRVRERVAACPYALDDLASFVLLWGLVTLATGRIGSTLVAVALGGLLGVTGWPGRDGDGV